MRVLGEPPLAKIFFVLYLFEAARALLPCNEIKRQRDLANMVRYIEGHKTLWCNPRAPDMGTNGNNNIYSDFCPFQELPGPTAQFCSARHKFEAMDEERGIYFQVKDWVLDHWEDEHRTTILGSHRARIANEMFLLKLGGKLSKEQFDSLTDQVFTTEHILGLAGRPYGVFGVCASGSEVPIYTQFPPTPEFARESVLDVVNFHRAVSWCNTQCRCVTDEEKYLRFARVLSHRRVKPRGSIIDVLAYRNAHGRIGVTGSGSAQKCLDPYYEKTSRVRRQGGKNHLLSSFLDQVLDSSLAQTCVG